MLFVVLLVLAALAANHEAEAQGCAGALLGLGYNPHKGKEMDYMKYAREAASLAKKLQSESEEKNEVERAARKEREAADEAYVPKFFSSQENEAAATSAEQKMNDLRNKIEDAPAVPTYVQK